MTVKTKKIMGVCLAILISLVICWMGMVAIDSYRCGILLKPLFVIEKCETDETGVKTYQGLGYRVEMQQDLTHSESYVTAVTMKMFNKVVSASIV